MKQSLSAAASFPYRLEDMEYQSDWTGSSFEGECKNGWFEGHGKYKFASGVVYEGQFHKGDFHGEGRCIKRR